MTSAAALFVVAAFVLLAKLFRVPNFTRSALRRSRRAFRDLRDPALDERAKEQAVRSHAGRLLLLFFGITLASATAAALPLGLVALLDVAGVVEFAAVVQRTVSPIFLLVVTPFGVAAALLLYRRRR